MRNIVLRRALFLLVIISLFIIQCSGGAGNSGSGTSSSTLCNSSVGLISPVSVCTAANPCTNLLSTYAVQGITVLTAPSDVPVCRTQFPTATATLTGCTKGGRGNYDDSSAAHSWVDQDLTNRSWCEFRPAGSASSSKRPLLIYVPGSGGSAGDIYDYTLLRTKAVSFDLSGDAARPGFILVSVQGRNLHWPTPDPEEGSKHDSMHRNLTTNRDVKFFDYLIDSLVAEGVVDPRRIYITGWSNGARFAAFYGIARHESTTPGGNRVAAAAVYSGGDPYENISSTQAPSCKQDPYPATSLPYFLISRNCDLIACNQDQYTGLINLGVPMAPGNQAEGWINSLTTTMTNANVEWTRIGYYATATSSCLAVGSGCTQAMAIRNHFCWPDGVSDGSGIDRELDLLAFLRDHPLP